MWDTLVRYYGVDWIATTISLASIYFIGDGRRIGFALGMVGAVLWAAFSVMASSLAGTLLNALLLFLFARGYLNMAAARCQQRLHRLGEHDFDRA